MTDYAALVVRLRKQAKCVYLAAELGPATDLSDGLIQAANAIEELEARLERGVDPFLQVLDAAPE
jgi:thiamine monophosphate kinase